MELDMDWDGTGDFRADLDATLERRSSRGGNDETYEYSRATARGTTSAPPDEKIALGAEVSLVRA